MFNMKNIFNSKQIKYSLIIGFTIISCLIFLNWKKENLKFYIEAIMSKNQNSERPIIDLEHRLIFLPKTVLTYKYYRNCETNDWPLFTDEKSLFSLRYPSESSFEVERETVYQYDYSNSYLAEGESGLELIEYYRIGLNKAFEKSLGGPYGFFFNVGVYKITKTLANEEYIKPFLTARESKLMYPEEIKTWPFIVCKPIDLENASAELCKISYCYGCAEDFYITYKDKFYVINRFETKEKSTPPEWLQDEQIVGITYRLQEKLLFQTIVSTFKALD